METANTTITVATRVKAPVAEVWNYWNGPEHITQWCFASDDWHAPFAENDLRVGGRQKTTMAAKDGSFSFDFEGEYSEVRAEEFVAYTIADGRRVEIIFKAEGEETEVIETFEPEATHSLDMQKAGWQAILDNFKKYAESKKGE